MPFIVLQDYGTWEHFNFHRPNGVAPDLDGEEEIVGDCMALKLRITPDLEDEVAYVSQAVSNAMAVDEVDDDEEQAGRNDALNSDYDPTRRNEPLKVAKTLIHSLVPQSTPSLLSSSTSTSHSNSETSRKPVNKPLRFTGSFSNVRQTFSSSLNLSLNIFMSEIGFGNNHGGESFSVWNCENDGRRRCALEIYHQI